MKRINYLLNKATASNFRSSLGRMIFVLLFASFFALLPHSASAQCAQWNLSGNLSIQQEKTVVLFDLAQNGTLLAGRASYSATGKEINLGIAQLGADSITRMGDVDGSIMGNAFTVKVYWDGNHKIGVYTGTISATGRIEGDVYGEENPNVKVRWYSINRVGCAPAVAAKKRKMFDPVPPAANTEQPQPIQHTGVRRTGHATIVEPATDPVKPVPAALTAPGIIASPNNIALVKGKSKGTTTLTWDAGRVHPNAEVWVKVDDEDETKVVATGKGTLQVTVVPGKSYLYILKDAGKTLARVIVEFHR